MDYSSPGHRYTDLTAHDETYRIEFKYSDWTPHVYIYIKRPWYLPNKYVLKHHWDRYGDYDNAIAYYKQLVNFYRKDPTQLPLS